MVYQTHSHSLTRREQKEKRTGGGFGGVSVSKGKEKSIFSLSADLLAVNHTLISIQ